MMTVRDLSLFVAGHELLAGLSFDILPGEFLGILGANGVGKTTLLRTLAGLRPIEHGNVRIDDRDARALSSAERSRAIALITGDELFADRLTVREVVSAGRYPHHHWWQWREERSDADAIAYALAAVDLEGFAEREFLTLSSGERQRVWLALALAQEAPLMLLDEPTSHLDLRAAHEILHLLRAQASGGKAVVCVMHDPNEAAAFSDRVILLGKGGILAAGPRETVLSPEQLELAYGLPMESLRTESGAPRVFPRHPA